ncbi:MAG: RNA polymerase factor sigma-54 [Rhodospirillales bacterium]|jgi:RNA polymerase sigma-54 factor|nr:RNA polymerase factor sigma-54 [Rhodospirillales bacterium]
MAITPRLELRQGQSLVMTPQLQQAIKLLQLNNIELKEFIELELAENPMLERDESDGALPEEAPPETEQEGDAESEDGEAPDGLETLDLSQVEHVTEESAGGLDMDDYGNVWDDGGGQGAPGAEEPVAFSDWGGGGSVGFQDHDYGVEQTLSQGTSLRDHLVNQINMDIADPADRLVAVHLTDMLDESGRLPEDWDEAAERLGCEMAKLEAILDRLQQFDPPGIYARDLAECWSIQLREMDRLDPAMEMLLGNIELLKLHEYEKLSKICLVDMEDIKEMIDEIWALNHRPAEAFDEVLAQPITPDVIMRASGNGWIVELNNETLPKVLINNHYYAEISGAVRTKEERQYVTDKFQSANWLVKSIHQRATTILKVASEIVKQQADFFRFGIQHLKPLVLRDIAEEIEMHESTVSRVTSNKYMHTPRGIFELKYFFTSAIGSSMGGEAHSAESVRHRIKKLIDAEPPAAILSDDKLVTVLRGEGIDIARRTVAKYRESMRIPSSVQRRREKKSALQLI